MELHKKDWENIKNINQQVVTLLISYGEFISKANVTKQSGEKLMSKRKSNIHNVNIQNLNMEIDYDKLAEAIVKAEKKAEEIDELPKTTEKVSMWALFKAIFKIIFCKAETHGLTNSFFSAVTSFCFKLFGYVGCISSLLMFGIALYNVFMIDWSITILKSSFYEYIVYFIIAGLSAIFFIFSVMMIGASREVEKEKDKNYVVAIFSGIVSFAALVVALVAMMKGVAV